MAESTREDRIILTVGAIGRGIASEPEAIQRLQKRLRLEEALEPFRKKGRKRRSFSDVLEEEGAGRTSG
jgi:hypothetical protein